MLTNRRPATLHSLNAMRVLGEYFVVRFHCFVSPNHSQEKLNMGPVGEDIMSFFFVLSGFASMYAHERTDFSGWSAKGAFLWRRFRRVYPLFILNMLFTLPSNVVSMMSPTSDCQLIRLICPVLQIFMLDGWAGCGWRYIFSGSSWFLSCIMWLWLVFPIAKEFIADTMFGGGAVWLKLIGVYCICILPFFVLWGHDMMTLAGVPALRVGEFLLGCGAACALRVDTPWILAGSRFWIPSLRS